MLFIVKGIRTARRKRAAANFHCMLVTMTVNYLSQQLRQATIIIIPFLQMEKAKVHQVTITKSHSSRLWPDTHNHSPDLSLSHSTICTGC